MPVSCSSTAPSPAGRSGRNSPRPLLIRSSIYQAIDREHLVESHGEDRARCESYGVAIHRSSGGEERGNLTTGFRFIDDFERRAGEWRIVRRVATTEWVQVSREEDQWPVPPTMLAGRRGRSDPVYAPWGS